MNKEEFIEECKKINIIVEENQLKKLDQFYHMMIEWNEKINLTRITKEEEVYLKHFYDSLTINKVVDLKKVDSLCDVGTGAGFPGIVLKIVFPNLNVTLVDALKKRIDFLNIVIEKLELKNIVTVHERAEIFTKKNREKYDLVTCRAVAKLNIISELCIPSVKVNGYFIPMKANIEEEISNTEYLEKLNSKIENIVTFKLPIENSIRNLIIIKKIDKTTSIYPRKNEKIQKFPL